MNRVLFFFAVLLVNFAGLRAQYRSLDSYFIGGDYGFFKSDFGQRFDWGTNTHNNSYELTGKLYFNLVKYQRPFSAHYRVFANINFTYGSLKHLGEYAEKNSVTGQRLRAMTANPILVGLGVGGEYHWRNLRDFNYKYFWGGYKFDPYVGISMMAYYYTPRVKSTLGDVNDPGAQPSILHPRFVGHIYNGNGFTGAVSVFTGLSYQIKPGLNLVWENKFTWFPNDKVDGLDVDDQPDKFADWIYSPVIGVEYVLP